VKKPQPAGSTKVSEHKRLLTYEKVIKANVSASTANVCRPTGQYQNEI